MENYLVIAALLFCLIVSIFIAKKFTRIDADNNVFAAFNYLALGIVSFGIDVFIIIFINTASAPLWVILLLISFFASVAGTLFVMSYKRLAAFNETENY